MNGFDYHLAVFLVTMSTKHWDDLNPTEDDMQRFVRRRNHGWEKPDSMYDAWLLIEGTPREVFDMDEFRKRFPRWDRLMLQKFGVDEDNSGGDENETSVSNARKRGPRTMLVSREPKTPRLSLEESINDDDDDDEDEDDNELTSTIAREIEQLLHSNK